MSTVLDPLADAVQAAESASQYFGKLEVDGQYVVLRKGERKRVWIEGESTDGRQSEITIRLNPLDITGMTRLVERQVLANSGEWSRIVWPSLRDLGCRALTEIKGKYGHVQLVPSGRTWQNKEGETVTGTTFKFIALFDLESDAIKAWESLGNTQAHTTAAPQADPQPTSPPSDTDRAKYLVFLPTFVQMSNGNLDTLKDLLQKNTPGFTVDSPEVQQLLKAA